MDMHFPWPSPAMLRSASSPRSQEVVPVTWLGMIIYIQFAVGAVITLFTLLGISIGHEIARVLLLAVLQILIAVSGSAYTFQKNYIFLLVYVAAQLWTGLSEVIWAVIHLVGGGCVSTAVLLGMLAFVQFFSVGTVFCCRDKIVFHHAKNDLDTHLRVSATRNTATLDLTLTSEVEQHPPAVIVVKKTSQPPPVNASQPPPTDSTRTAVENEPPHQEVTGSSEPVSENGGSSERAKEIRKMIADMSARVERRSQESLRESRTSPKSHTA